MLLLNNMVQAKEKLALSVTQANDYLNTVLGEHELMVEGEVGGFNVNQGRLVFFDLKDEQSVLACFMMAYSLRLPLEDGMKVKITGTPGLYKKNGRFRLMVSQVELVGEGALKRAFELTKAKLQAEGLFVLERKRSLPRFPEKIGLITSREAAAYTDFLRILNNRWSGVTINFYHAQVQGASARPNIVQAFQYFNEHPELADVVVLTRGGGSLEDLQAFNSEEVARAVFGSKIPVVCGVGHERDESLADFVADVRAATPSNAAELVVPDRREIVNTIETIEQAQEDLIRRLVATKQQQVDHDLTKIVNVIDGKLQHAGHVFQRLILVSNTLLAAIREQFTAVDFAVRTLTSLNPLTLLRRGYSIVFKDGKIIQHARALRTGDGLKVRLSDGEVWTKVTGTSESGQMRIV